MLLLPLYKSENLVLGKKKNEHLGEFPSDQSICLCVCVRTLRNQVQNHPTYFIKLALI